MTEYDWEPSYGFCSWNTNDNVELAKTLEVIRRQVCAYNWGQVDGDVRCDCKYGLTLGTDTRFGSEQTGCPELRELIDRLLHRPESFNV